MLTSTADAPAPGAPSHALSAPTADVDASSQRRLLFAVPKKGRLYEHCLRLLQGIDVHFHRHNRLDIASATNIPVSVIFLPAADIPKFVAQGSVDLGITGQDVIAEAGVTVRELAQLGFGKCRLCVQVPVASPYKSPHDLVGKRIVTSFTRLASTYFNDLVFNGDTTKELGCRAEPDTTSENTCPSSTNSTAPHVSANTPHTAADIFGLTQKQPASFRIEAQKQGVESADNDINTNGGNATTTINYVSGSVEAACALGLADGIVDLVESGETMRAAGLQPVATIMVSESVLIQNPHTNHTLVPTIVARIQGYVAAQKYVYVNYNVERCKLPDAVKITPGRKAPTISPLDESDWVSVSSMVEKVNVAEKMDQLQRIGATDILVFNISNCRV